MNCGLQTAGAAASLPVRALRCSAHRAAAPRARARPLPRRIQSLFNALGSEAQGKTIGVGGDGRYFNKEAVQASCHA